MLRAVRVFDRHSGDISACSENEIRMVDAVFATVRHPNNEWTKGTRVKQLANLCLHGQKITRRFGIV